MERLEEREAEIRHLGSENTELKSELRHLQQLGEREASKSVDMENACGELTDRLNEREEELRVMSRENYELTSHQKELEMACSKLEEENSELKNELTHFKQLNEQEASKSEELESAWDELTERLNMREEELNAMARENDELVDLHKGLEMTCSKLERALDAREQDLSAMENELRSLQSDLKRAVDATHSRNRDVCTLENKVEDLVKEVEYYKVQVQEEVSMKNHLHKREAELKSILKENDIMLEQQEKEITLLSRKTRGLEIDADTQSSMLEEQEQDLTNMQRMVIRLNNVIKSQDVALDKKDNAILQLTMDIERYEKMMEEAEHITWAQRQKMKAEMQDRETMMAEIKKLKDELDHERSGLMSFWDKGCGAKS
jgi:chromosome segregation ATPase